MINVRQSQLNLVDLAGSERQKDTSAVGIRLKASTCLELVIGCDFKSCFFQKLDCQINVVLITIGGK